MVYIGVDLHRKKTQVAAIDEQGGLVFNRKVRTDPGDLQQLMDELRPQPVEVAFEATLGWGWFADLLAELGIPAHMAHPPTTKANSTARVKNDSVDVDDSLSDRLWAQPSPSLVVSLNSERRRIG